MTLHKQRLLAQVLPDVRLVQHHVPGRVQRLAVLCGLCSHPEACASPPSRAVSGEAEAAARDDAPSGTFCMLYTITPPYCGVPSVMRAMPAFVTWLPYKNAISEDGFTHTLYCAAPGERGGDRAAPRPPTLAYCARMSKQVTCRRKRPVLVNLPNLTPTLTSWSRAAWPARFSTDSLRGRASAPPPPPRPAAATRT